MPRVLILGAGGHALVVADVLLSARAAGADFELVGFLDDDPVRIGTVLWGAPVLAPLTRVADVAHDAVIVAIGDNGARARAFDMARERGEEFVSLAHPTAVLGRSVRLGRGSVVCAGVVVNAESTIGDNVILNTGCTVDHHNLVGTHAHIAPGVHLGGGVEVGEGAFVGIGAAAIPGRSIGPWSVVGAGAVVIADVPPFSTAVGVPARVIRRGERTAYGAVPGDRATI